jgi:MFS family permease
LFSSFSPLFIIPFVLFQGGGYGVLSIIRPTVISELLGRRDFGTIAGLLAIGFMAGSAFSPTSASILWETGGYDLVIIIVAGIPIMAFLSLLAAWKVRP